MPRGLPRGVSLFSIAFLRVSATLLFKGAFMSKHVKLIKRFLAHPVDFTWDEMKALLMGFTVGGQISNLSPCPEAGKTGGSRVRFDHRTSDPIILHQPHPAPTLKRYQIEQVEEILKRGDLL